LALSVVIGHSDHSFGLPGLNNTLAVRSFYLISGFYMALVLDGKYRDKPYYVFIRSRYMRLYPAYLTVLALSILYGITTYFIRGTSEWPLHSWTNTVTELSDSSIIFYTLSNVFMIGQDILGYCSVADNGHLFFDYLGKHANAVFSGYMIVPQAWTLGIEFTFYLIAPFLIVRSTSLILLVIFASFALKHLVLPFLGIAPDGFGYRFFPFEVIYFCFGGLAFKLYKHYCTKPLSQKQHYGIALLLAIPFLSFSWDIPDWVRYAAIALCIPSLFMATKANRIDRLIGELSYPVYISHILIFYALAQYTKIGNELPGVVITLLLSAAIHAGVERFADARRKTLFAAPASRLPSAKGGLAGLAVILLTLCVPFAVQHYLNARHAAASARIENYNFLRESPEKVTLIGFDPPETNGESSWRWGLGEKSEILFSLPHKTNFNLTFQFFSLLADQTVSVYFNGMFLEKFQLKKDDVLYRTFPLPARKSDNVIRFVYETWNGKEQLQIANDTRPLAACFNILGIAF